MSDEAGELDDARLRAIGRLTVWAANLEAAMVMLAIGLAGGDGTAGVMIAPLSFEQHCGMVLRVLKGRPERRWRDMGAWVGNAQAFGQERNAVIHSIWVTTKVPADETSVTAMTLRRFVQEERTTQSIEGLVDRARDLATRGYALLGSLPDS